MTPEKVFKKGRREGARSLDLSHNFYFRSFLRTFIANFYSLHVI